MLRKLGSYPRQNGLGRGAPRAGPIERTLFTWSWLQSWKLRSRVHAGLNKGEARNALARAVFKPPWVKSATAVFGQQRYRLAPSIGKAAVVCVEPG
ncbi:Tn3 family transposase [Klebsiella pneumoniae]|nr:Tn3 family transposase [Klebsiella pneumoniae]